MCIFAPNSFSSSVFYDLLITTSGFYLTIICCCCRPAKVDQVKFDVMELHARPELAAQQHMVDDGSGEVKVQKNTKTKMSLTNKSSKPGEGGSRVSDPSEMSVFIPQVWRIEKLELAEVKPNLYGQFYGGDCYLVLYTYQVSNRKQYLLYMWQVGMTSNLKLFILLPIKHILHADSLTSGTSRHEGRDHGERLSGRQHRQHVQRSPGPGPSGHGKGASPLPGYIQRQTHHF